MVNASFNWHTFSSVNNCSVVPGVQIFIFLLWWPNRSCLEHDSVVILHSNSSLKEGIKENTFLRFEISKTRVLNLFFFGTWLLSRNWCLVTMVMHCILNLILIYCDAVWYYPQLTFLPYPEKTITILVCWSRLDNSGTTTTLMTPRGVHKTTSIGSHGNLRCLYLLYHRARILQGERKKGGRGDLWSKHFWCESAYLECCLNKSRKKKEY